MRFFYIDESHDDEKFCLSAICIRHHEWDAALDLVRTHRAEMRQEHGFYVRKEIHARDLVTGRGKIAPKDIDKWTRSRIYLSLLSLVARLPHVKIYNVCLEKKGRRDPQLDAWDRMINRIQKAMQAYDEKEIPERARLVALLTGLEARDRDLIEQRLTTYAARAVIIADEGREKEITRALRRMHVHNPIPSQFGGWGAGATARNFPTRNIIEDPIFKKSDESFMLQLADCVAFALLKREVEPTAVIKKYGIHKMFDRALVGACERKASFKDPLGIVRK